MRGADGAAGGRSAGSAAGWMPGVRHRSLFVLALVLVLPANARAQSNLQLWGTATFNWVKSEKLSYELEFEPQVLVAAPEGDPAWRSFNLTPNAEYAAKKWLDFVIELPLSYTKQTDEMNTLELTGRAGLRFHLFSRGVPTRVPGRVVQRELPPSRRIVVRDLVRAESRNFFYSGSGSGTSSSVRFRNRLEVLVPLNRERLSDDGARYLLADWEWFIPLGEPDERFASKQRIRAGFGYRRSFAWRFEVLYIWNRSKDTIQDGYSTSDHIIDLRFKRVF